MGKGRIESMSIHDIPRILCDNKEWVFSGIGIFLLGGIVGGVKYLYKRFRKENKEQHVEAFKQINTGNATGTQIGTQNNYYQNGDDLNERDIKGSDTRK